MKKDTQKALAIGGGLGVVGGIIVWKLFFSRGTSQRPGYEGAEAAYFAGWDFVAKALPEMTTQDHAALADHLYQHGIIAASPGVAPNGPWAPTTVSKSFATSAKEQAQIDKITAAGAKWWGRVA